MKKNISFGENLKIECFHQGINLKQLAKMTGVSYTTLLSYTKKEGVLPRVDIAWKIAKVLDVSIEYLLNDDEKNASQKLPTYPIYSELKQLEQKYLKPLSILVHVLANNID